MARETTRRPAASAGGSRFLAWVSAEAFFVVGVVVAIFFAILSPDVSKALKLDASQLGTLSGTFFISYSVGQLVIGSLLGPCSPRLILGSMALLSAAGCVLFAVSTSMPLALAARVLLGLGLSVSFVGVMHVIGRDYPDRFSFMASLSQSLANVAGALIALAASFTTLIGAFRGPFTVIGLVFVPIGIALLLFIGNRSGDARARADAEPMAPIGTVLATCFGSLQFWAGLVFYSCLFGTVLAYSDLWDIQFQMSDFGHSAQQSALLNAAIPLGITVGSLVAGVWAQARGDFVLPARVFALFGVLVFALMYVLVLDMPMAIAANFCIGFALAGSILGFTVIQKHLPAYAKATGTAIVATAAFLAGGAIQPLIGIMVEAPVGTNAVFSHLLLEAPVIGAHLISDPDFATYQKGMLLIFISVLIGFLASLLFKRAPAPVGDRPDKG